MQQTVCGQEIERRFKNYSLEDGLSQSTIFDIKQDKQGYTWIATADGLNVFNGAEFEVYKKDPSNKNSLSSNFIYTVLPLDNGLVWAVTQDRVINEINPSLKTVKQVALLDNLQENMYSAKKMLHGFNGEIWLSTYDNGVLVLNQNAKVIRKLNVQNKQLISNTINEVSKHGDKIYVCTDTGISIFTKNEKQSKNVLIGKSVGSAYSHKNHLYISDFTHSLLLKYRTNNFAIKPDTLLYGQDIVDIVATKNGTVWAGSLAEGLFEIVENTVHHYKHSPTDRWSLIDNNIFYLSKDANEDIWIGTNSGFSIYKKAYNVFKLLRRNASGNSLSSNKIYQIYEDKNANIWFVNYNGSIDVLYPNGKFKNFTPNKETITIRLRSIMQVSEDYFIVGTSNSTGLFKFYPSKELFIPFNNINLKQIRKVKKTNNNEVLIAHEEGLGRLNLKTEVFTSNILDSSYSIYDFIEKDGKIYIASFGRGFLIYDKSAGDLEVFKEAMEGSNLRSSNIMSIVPISDHELALGTYGGGLSIFDIKNNSFKSLTESQGLRNNAVYGILQDNNKNLWVSTNIGISRVSADFKSIKNYDLPIQLQSLEFNEDSYLKSSTGKFYFGGVNGLNFFEPKNITENRNSPMAIINGVIVENKRVNFSQEDKLSFNYKENDVAFLISARRISVPEKTTFQYMLEGLDNEWRTSTFSNEIAYNNIPPGNYSFKIKSCNEDGFCDEKYEEFNFTIKAPIYKTWWFLALIGLFIGAAIFTFFRYRTNNLRAEYAAKMTNAELRALRIQMNPHFIFNSLNSIQYYVLNSDSKTAYKYLTKFSSLMRKTLQHSKENFLPLKDELKALQLYLDLENLRLENTLESTIKVHAEIDAEKTLIPTLFLQPFVENSILHGLLPKQGQRKMKIIVEPLTKGFQCIIRDNGIGRKASNELNKNRNRSHQSTALEAIENRIKIINTSGNIKVSMTIEDLEENNNPCGTQVTLKIV